jgi:hypothetical protein
MSLAVFESFLKFAEQVIAVKATLPSVIDPAELESALVSHGVVLLHAHMEECLRSAAETRCRRCPDPELLNLALNVAGKEMGRIGIPSLKETLGRFGDAYKATFKSHLDTFGLDDQNNGSWISIINQRAIVAHHGQPATCSLADLRLYYADIRRILRIFCHALSLNASEITAVSPLIVTVAPPAAPPSVSPVAPPSSLLKKAP